MHPLPPLSPQRTQGRQGFTLIELLASVAIIALLAALLTPAVIAVRTAQLRAQTNNLIQRCFLAFQQYAAEEGQLPPADHGHFIAESGIIAALRNRRLLSVSGEDIVTHSISGSNVRLLGDAWDMPIRYVIGSGGDDHGRVPSNHDTANWQDDDDRFYIYSYGGGSENGSDSDSWIYPLKGGG